MEAQQRYQTLGNFSWHSAELLKKSIVKNMFDPMTLEYLACCEMCAPMTLTPWSKPMDMGAPFFFNKDMGAPMLRSTRERGEVPLEASPHGPLQRGLTRFFNHFFLLSYFSF
jgi:hypothetical protein